MQGARRIAGRRLRILHRTTSGTPNHFRGRAGRMQGARGPINRWNRSHTVSQALRSKRKVRPCAAGRTAVSPAIFPDAGHECAARAAWRNRSSPTSGKLDAAPAGKRQRDDKQHPCLQPVMRPETARCHPPGTDTPPRPECREGVDNLPSPRLRLPAWHVQGLPAALYADGNGFPYVGERLPVPDPPGSCPCPHRRAPRHVAAPERRAFACFLRRT